jgi:hypothetical protein
MDQERPTIADGEVAITVLRIVGSKCAGNGTPECPRHGQQRSGWQSERSADNRIITTIHVAASGNVRRSLKGTRSPRITVHGVPTFAGSLKTNAKGTATLFCHRTSHVRRLTLAEPTDKPENPRLKTIMQSGKLGH